MDVLLLFMRGFIFHILYQSTVIIPTILYLYGINI